MTLPKKSQVAADAVAALLEEAKDPTQSPERLRAIWNSTKSVRVRKAVASNPNADSKTMAMAARLYIREVIENPSFEMINLFAEDKMVKTLYDAYMAGSSARSLMSIRGVADRTNVARAILVSPNLTAYSALQEVCSVLSGAEFTRELKDPDVESRVRIVAKRGTGFYKLPTLLFLKSNGVLSTKDLGNVMSKMGTAESHTTRGVYVNTVFEYMEKCDADPEYRQILKDFIRINLARNVRELIKAVRKDAKYQSQRHLSMFAWLYREFLKDDVERLRKQRQDYRERYGYSGSHYLGDSCHSHHLSDLMWMVISQRNGTQEKSVTDIDLTALYSDLKLTGFDKDYGPYACGMKFGELKFLTGRNNMCRKLIELKDDDAFLFFTTCGILWSEWYAKGDISNPEHKVVSRLHRINEQRFGQGNTPLYTYSFLDDFPCIRVMQTNGLQHDTEKYRINIDLVSR